MVLALWMPRPWCWRLQSGGLFLLSTPAVGSLCSAPGEVNCRQVRYEAERLLSAEIKEVSGFRLRTIKQGQPQHPRTWWLLFLKTGPDSVRLGFSLPVKAYFRKKKEIQPQINGDFVSRLAVYSCKNTGWLIDLCLLVYTCFVKSGDGSCHGCLVLDTLAVWSTIITSYSVLITAVRDVAAFLAESQGSDFH